VTWVAVAIGGSALVGAGASYLGSKKQSEGAERAGQISMDMFDVLNRQQQPFMQGGYGAMGRLNTLLGLNPSPRARMPMPSQNPGYMPTPGGGVQPIMQVGPGGAPPGDRRMYGHGGGTRLNELLALRAANGDRQAQFALYGRQV
jgi:hypothetical protein